MRVPRIGLGRSIYGSEEERRVLGNGILQDRQGGFLIKFVESRTPTYDNDQEEEDQEWSRDTAKEVVSESLVPIHAI